MFVTTSATAEAPTVSLKTGTYQGLATQLANSSITVHKYLGIPFAQPPLGKFRFAPAQHLNFSNALRKADSQPPACIQNGGNSDLIESEDCLYLNVFAPAPNWSSKGKSVMVWLFGGGLQSGTAAIPLYDGSSFAANQDVTLVAPNYRTNVFGFPGIDDSIPIQQRNIGLLDQRLALAWVQQNIAKFGGDPNQVTLFGQSAGARSADFHLLTMPDSPPFRAVIMQSGSSELTPLADAKRAAASASKGPSFAVLAKMLGCDSQISRLDCMRSVPAELIKRVVKANGLYFGSTDDGGFTTVKDQAAVRRAHRAANVPVLIGTNADEQRGGMASWTNKTLQEYLDTTFENESKLKKRLREAYVVSPGSRYTTDFDAMTAIATDMSFTCITAREAKISAELGYPTWRYLFNASFPNIEKFPGSGAYHGSEIQFVFGNMPDGSTLEELALSKLMQKTWANFAKDQIQRPGWKADELGQYGYDGKLREDSHTLLDTNCALFTKMYEGRA